MPCDVTKDEDIARVFAEVDQKFGQAVLRSDSRRGIRCLPKDLEGEFVSTREKGFAWRMTSACIRWCRFRVEPHHS